MHVVRKQRVETYLEPETVEQIADLARDRATSSSDVVREAVHRELERAGMEVDQ